jgi:uncharacterized membrane protein
MSDTLITSVDSEKEASAKNVATLVYALQAAWLLFGIPLVIALIVNYVKLDDVRGTLAESHFRWQIRTFWYGLLWGVVGWILVFVLIGFAILFANCVWLIYRIVKGWLYLNDGKPMY